MFLPYSLLMWKKIQKAKQFLAIIFNNNSKASMARTLKYFFLFLIGIGIVLSLISDSQADSKASAPLKPVFIRIGTASVSGLYYATGGAICKFLQKSRAYDNTKNLYCSVQSTPGAMYNLNALRNHDLEIAIAQGDWEYNAVKGINTFKAFGPMLGLRSIISTHKEGFTVLVRKSSNINNFDDIRGKIVNIGAPGTGVRGTMENVMQIKNWTKADFKLATELNSGEQAQALCDGKIDVMLNVIGHPNGLFQEATATCESKFIPLDKETLEKLINEFNYYSYYEIPGKIYMGNEEATPTIAVQSSFYTLADTPDSEVYDIIEAVFDNFTTLKNLHPAFYNLTKADLVPKTLSPIHEGALKYYKRVGLIQESKAGLAEAHEAIENRIFLDPIEDHKQRPQI